MTDALDEFVAVMRQLRAECPWKQEQTHRSLVRYLLEEAHETAEAIEAGDDEHLREELGDLLLQVVFHAVIAEQRGAFGLDEVAGGITEKMRRRNPHVFGEASGDLDAGAVNDLWQQVKAQEKGPSRTSPEEGIPAALPALLYADKVLDRLRRAGRPADVDPASDDVGERLLALVEEALDSGVDPEQSLRDAVRRRL